MMMWPVTSLLAHLWHPKRANERQLPTNTVGRRARLDDGSGAFLPVAVACNERPVRVGWSHSADVGRIPAFGGRCHFRLRYSGASYGFHMASIIAGGPAPLIATALLARFGSGYAVALYILFCALVSIVATSLLPDYTNRDISTEHDEV